jgi:hypothetical protein
MKKILYSLTLASLLLTAGCKKSFLDINVSPNSATEQNIGAAQILPYAMHATAARMGTSYGWTGNWIGYWGPSGTYAPDVVESTYNITTGFQSGQWTGWYDILNDLNVAEKKAKLAGQDFYEGMAILMAVPGWMSLVDMYNNIPYSEAFDLVNKLTPAYDNGQDIYNDLLVRIKYAIDKIKGAQFAANPGVLTTDIMFGAPAFPSDQALYAKAKQMWAKFGNTLRLKLLIHQSQIPGFSPTATINDIVTEGSGFLAAGESAKVVPAGGYLVSAGKLNPFWNAYKTDQGGNETNDYYRANNYVLNLMKNNQDERYKRIFSPAGNGSYTGVTYGDPPAVATNSSNTSNVSGPGLATSNTQPQWVLTSFESLFLQAEAIIRGWLPGNGQTAYENAVRESFVYLGVPNANSTATTYLAGLDVNGNPNPVTNWASVAAGTTTQKVAFVALQKYIAMTGTNNLEAWTDYRRLNVPSNIPISTNVARISNTIPISLLYSQTEYSFNQANVSAQGTINQFTSQIFWDK